MTITYDEPKIQRAPGHIKYYYIHFFKNNEMIPGIARGDTPEEALAQAEILKEKLEKMVKHHED